MKVEYRLSLLCIVIAILMTGCDSIGSKSTSMSVIYGIAVVGALLMLGTYYFVVKKKEIWFLLLFASILVVNIGYFLLAISKTLEEALFANRVAYLGSVFLPLSMFMMIITLCKIKYKKVLPIVLMIISIVVFVIAASPGYFDIYYKEVEFSIINGVGSLNKTYGPWHSIYLYYLVIYFSAMVLTIIYASNKKLLSSNIYAVIIAGAVLVNIVVWLIEQLVSIEFEILSLSYIISEFFLICFCSLRQEEQSVIEVKEEIAIDLENSNENTNQRNEDKITDEDMEVIEIFKQGIEILTPKEYEIYKLYLENKSTKEVLEELNITENTLKYHNKNIYSKLGVSSRKQLKNIGKNLE